MAFIGNTPISVAFLTDTFSGNGSTTAFTMTVAPANTSSIIVAITGVLQDPSTYSVSGTTLTFSAAPPTGTSNISVRYLGIPASGVTTTAYRTVTNFTATAGQTSFSVPSYTVGYIDVYRNGVRLVSTDFTATTGTTVVLVNACTSGDAVVTESFYVSSVLNAIPATAGSVAASYLVDGSVTTTKLADVATQANQETATSTTTLVTSGRQQYHPSAAKVWCRWQPNGTLDASFNVTSITDTGIGVWVVNFTTAFSNVNYAAFVCAGSSNVDLGQVYISGTGQAVGSCTTLNTDAGAVSDPSSHMMFVAFGDQ